MFIMKKDVVLGSALETDYRVAYVRCQTLSHLFHAVDHFVF